MSQRNNALTEALPLLSSLLLLVTVFSIFISQNWHTIRSVKLANTDRELTHIAVFAAEKGQAFSGAFSHHQFRHPGPFHFYYLAALKQLPLVDGNDHAKFRIGMLLFWFGALLFAVCFLSRQMPGSLVPILLVPLMLLVVRNYDRDIFTDYWNPHFGVPAFLVFLLGAAVAMNSAASWVLGVAALAGSIAVQAHVGSALVVSTVLGFVFLILIFKRKLDIGAFSALLGTTLIIWAPSIYESILKSDIGWGNFGALLSHFLESPGAKNPWNGISRTLSFFASPFNLRADWNSTRLLALFLVIFPFFVIKRVPLRFPAELRNLHYLSVLALLVVFFSASRIVSGFQQYLLCFVFSLVAVMLFINFFALTALWGERLKEVGFGLKFASVLTTALILIYLSFPSKLPLIRTKQSNLGIEAIQKLDLKPGDNLYRISFSERGVYPFVSHLFYHLIPKGIDLCIEEPWGYLYGEAFECEGRERLVSLPDYVSVTDLQIDPLVDGQRSPEQVLIRKYIVTPRVHKRS